MNAINIVGLARIGRLNPAGPLNFFTQNASKMAHRIQTVDPETLFLKQGDND